MMVAVAKTVSVDVSMPRKSKQNDVPPLSLRKEMILATLQLSKPAPFLRAAGEAATSGRPTTSALEIRILDEKEM